MCILKLRLIDSFLYVYICLQTVIQMLVLKVTILEIAVGRLNDVSVSFYEKHVDITDFGTANGRYDKRRIPK